jgi:hypothetical protein
VHKPNEANDTRCQEISEFLGTSLPRIGLKQGILEAEQKGNFYGWERSE